MKQKQFSDIEKNQVQQDSYQVIKVKGSKFVMFFILFSAAIATIFCYEIYQSYLTRPKIKIEESGK